MPKPESLPERVMGGLERRTVVVRNASVLDGSLHAPPRVMRCAEYRPSSRAATERRSGSSPDVYACWRHTCERHVVQAILSRLSYRGLPDGTLDAV
jgi:hypothetical protein